MKDIIAVDIETFIPKSLADSVWMSVNNWSLNIIDLN